MMLDNELGNAKAELQSVFCQKLNYYLRDTTEGAADTVINLLSKNIGGLKDALVLKVSAFALKGDYSSAFALADSLQPLGCALMTLEKAVCHWAQELAGKPCIVLHKKTQTLEFAFLFVHSIRSK